MSIKEDPGQIITHFETLFGDDIDHEVIKIVLQACDWDSKEAHEKLLSLADSSKEIRSNECSQDSAKSQKTFASVATDSQLHLLETDSSKNTQNSECLSSLHNTNASNDRFDNAKHIDTCESIQRLINENQKVLIVMRGLPGSGKSTLASYLLNENGVILSTDDYFLDKYNNYDFKPAFLPEAHEWNKMRAKLNLESGFSPIIIDNTNLQLWEFVPYIKLALDSGYNVEILEPQTWWKYNCKELSKRGKHNVPEKKIKEMKQRFERNLTINEVLQKINYTSNPDSKFISNTPLESIKVYGNCSDDEPDVVIEGSEVEEKPNRNKSTGNSFESYSNKDTQKPFDFGNEFKALNTSKSLTEIEQPAAASDIKDLEWKPLSPSNIETTISWDSCPKNTDKASSLQESKPARNTKQKDKQGQDLYINDLEEEENDHDLISWDPVEEYSLLSWDDNTNNIVVAQCLPHTGAVPKIPANFEAGNSSNKIVDKPLIANNINLSSKNKIDNSSQYYTSDYSDSNTDAKIIEGNPLSFIPGLLEEIKDNEPLTKTRLVLHKSSMTDEFLTSPAENDNALQTLISFFPTVSKLELEDVLEQCDFDLNWATGLLIDGGYQIADSIDVDLYRDNMELSDDAEVLLEVENKSVLNSELFDYKVNADDSKMNNEEDEIKKMSDHLRMMELLDVKKEIESSFQASQTVDDRIRRLTKKDYTDLNINKIKNRKFMKKEKSALKEENECDFENLKKESLHYLQMEISPLFAAQLIETFGSIGSFNLASSFTKENLSICLPSKIAHLIYQCWIETLNNKCERENSNECENENFSYSFKDDEELARKLQHEEDSMTEHDDPYPADNPTSLQEIIDIEKALEMSTAKFKNNPDANKSSSVLSLHKLKEEFAHVDSSAVEKEYYNQSNNYQATKSLLNYKYGSNKSVPKTVLAPGTVIETKENTSETSAISDDANWDSPGVCVKDPQAYRDEAQLHILEKKKALKKAKEASQQGMKCVASYYAQIANVHYSKFKEANERASKKILYAVNYNKGPNVLDLHLLHVTEALRETQSFLSEKKRSLREKNLSVLEISIITGKGTHSIGNEPRLKPAIRYFLKSEGYSFQEYAGMFKVILQARLHSREVSP